MTADPVTVTDGTGAKAALTTLARQGITSMPVVDEHQRLCGILSEADLITDVADDPRAPERPVVIRPITTPRTVGDVYSGSPLTIGPEEDVTAAVDLMAARVFKSGPRCRRGPSQVDR